jgi:hypothetical protein
METYQRIIDRLDSASTNEMISSDMKKLYKTVASRAFSDGFEFNESSLSDVSSLQYAEVLNRRSANGVFETIDGFKERIRTSFRDSFFNPVTGINTQSDAQWWNTADIPLILSPNDATAYYASGGIPQQVIDKKVDGIMSSGLFFENSNWSESDLEGLLEYSKTLNYEDCFKKTLRDALVYGGALMTPWLKGDNVSNYLMSIGEITREYDKDFIEYWWEADRWNLVMVPNFNPSSRDYLYPEYMACPISGVTINTQRSAIVRINELPFWGTIQQIGWATPDFEGWIRSALIYEMMVRTTGMMGQQKNLMYTSVPLDAEIVMNSPNAMQDFAQMNQAAMASWSITNPKMFTQYGEIKTISQDVSGYKELVQIVRDDLGAKTGLTESGIFHSQSSGFSDNIEDVTLKQSQYLRQLGNRIAPQIKRTAEILALSYFGTRSKQVKSLAGLRVVFGSPVVMTNDDKMKAGNNFFQMMASGTAAGIPMDISARIASKFIQSVDIDEDTIEYLAKVQKLNNDKELAQNQSLSSGTGGTNAGGSDGSEGGTPTAIGPDYTQGAGIDPRAHMNSEPGSDKWTRKFARLITGKGAR